jgi:hypothetical protein
MSRVFVLQSGFVTTVADKLVRSADKDISFRDSLFVLDYRVTDTSNYYDEEVEQLFQQFRRDNSVLEKFEFREGVLRTVYRLFKSETIVPWLRLQMEQRTVGYLHKRFLRDVLENILLGKAREMENYQYYRLLLASEISRNAPHKPDDTEELLKVFIDSAHSNLISDILYSWTGTMRGVADVLGVMHVLFGPRHGPVSVASGA